MGDPEEPAAEDTFAAHRDTRLRLSITIVGAVAFPMELRDSTSAFHRPAARTACPDGRLERAYVRANPAPVASPSEKLAP